MGLKVLWFVNKRLSSDPLTSTGGWLDVTAQALVDKGVRLGVICQAPVDKVTELANGAVVQWLLPNTIKLGSNHLPPQHYVHEILKIVEQFNPDLVHVWGVEMYWGLLTARKLIDRPAVLEIQGLEGAYSRVFTADLTFREQVACLGLKELVSRSTMWQRQHAFRVWGHVEEEMIKAHKYINVNSLWTAAHVSMINPDAILQTHHIAIRKAFFNGAKWSHSGRPVLFCSAAYSVPYKGLHVAIRALAVLKRRYPDAELRIAGGIQRGGLLDDGYVRWMNREARRLGVESQVRWLGALSQEQLVVELACASAAIVPSFVETYCCARLEAMLVGTPTVVTASGGMLDLVDNGRTGLLFQEGDAVMCAAHVVRLIADRAYAEAISKAALAYGQAHCPAEVIGSRHLAVYQDVVCQANSGGGESS